MAGGALEGWMQQFGVARVQLSVDNHGGWDNSSVDWLLPVYQSPQNILFTQLGYRVPDGRQTVNMGGRLDNGKYSTLSLFFKQA